MNRPTQPIAYSIKDAADAVGCSESYIRRALHTTNVDPAEGVHYLPAKTFGGRIRILADDLAKWARAWQDVA